MTTVTIEGLGRTWQWPAADRDCRRVIFDMAADLDQSIAACRQRNVVVQAGGNMGVWPWLLAGKFCSVYTFEPDPACFRCLVANVPDHNVIKLQAALGDKPGLIGMGNDHPGNWGAQFVVANEPPYVPTLRIDDLGLTACDLICLDIEGAELPALRGAADVLSRYKPVIVIEDKGLSVRFGAEQGDAERWLAEFGYHVLASVHRDVILTAA